MILFSILFKQSETKIMKILDHFTYNYTISENFYSKEFEPILLLAQKAEIVLKINVFDEVEVSIKHLEGNKISYKQIENLKKIGTYLKLKCKIFSYLSLKEVLKSIPNYAQMGGYDIFIKTTSNKLKIWLNIYYFQKLNLTDFVHFPRI